jgi:hypothetical protein
MHVEQSYWIDFNKFEHFVNDDCTRSFLSLEVTRTGLAHVYTFPVSGVTNNVVSSYNVYW